MRVSGAEKTRDTGMQSLRVSEKEREEEKAKAKTSSSHGRTNFVLHGGAARRTQRRAPVLKALPSAHRRRSDRCVVQRRAGILRTRMPWNRAGGPTAIIWTRDSVRRVGWHIPCVPCVGA